MAVSGVDGRILLLPRNATQLRLAVTNGLIDLPDFIDIEQFSGITLTQSIVGGLAYNFPDQVVGCSTGFVVARNSDYVRGISTAGHCGEPARYSTSYGTNYNSSGQVSLSLRQQWVRDDMDFQWSTGGSPSDFPPLFWDGSAYVTVTGAEGATPGTWVCRSGRSTARTCGYVSDLEYYNSPYGYMGRVHRNSTYPDINKNGDSGGPVFKGSLAVGSVHGEDSAGNMYFMSLARLTLNNTGIGVVRGY